MRKRILSVLLAALMCLAMLPDTAVLATGSVGAGIATADIEAGDSNNTDEDSGTDSSKSLTVDGTATEGDDSTYTTIQAAIDFISEQDDKDGWTIHIESGNYTYFTVNQYISNLTITGDSDVTVDCSGGSIQLCGDMITLDGLTFTATDTAWSVPVIKDASSNAGIYYDSMVTIKDCDFKGNNAGCALWICRLNATVQNCTFDGFSYAIEIINETSTAAKIDTETTIGTITIDGNEVTDCDFFIHYGVRSGISLSVTDNTVTGSETEVCASLFAWEGESITVTGNTFVYAAFGLQNAINGVSAKDFLDTNTFICSYTADDYYNYSTGKDYSVTYYAPEQDENEPVWSVSPTGVSGTMAEYFAAALEGHENDNPLTFTTTDGVGDLVCMGLAYQALYITYVKAKTSEPDLTKVILSETTDENDKVVTSEVSEDTASAGDTVNFKLTSVIPTTLQDYINYEYVVDEETGEGKVVGSVKTIAEMEAEENEEEADDSASDSETSENPTEGSSGEENSTTAAYELTIHDVLDSGLTLNTDSFSVTLVTEMEGTDTTSGEPISYTVSDTLDPAYYTLTYASTDKLKDGCTFELTVDLLALYADGIIVESNFGVTAITITYSATLDDDATPGAYHNTAWVTYPDGESKHDEVVVKTYGISIFKYDLDTLVSDDTDSSDTEEDGGESTNGADAAESGDESTTDSDGASATAETTAATHVTAEGLKGAEFTVYSDEQLTDESIVTTLTTDKDGFATSVGLAAGTYYLKETTAPKNYVSSGSVITITIPEDVDDNTCLVYVDMANAAIPDTGGMGTTIFRIVGGCLLLAAVLVFIVTRRRRNDNEE